MAKSKLFKTYKPLDFNALGKGRLAAIIEKEFLRCAEDIKDLHKDMTSKRTINVKIEISPVSREHVHYDIGAKSTLAPYVARDEPYIAQVGSNENQLALFEQVDQIDASLDQIKPKNDEKEGE